MKKLKSLKLNSLSKKQLDERKMRNLVGGDDPGYTDGCRCGCQTTPGNMDSYYNGMNQVGEPYGYGWITCACTCSCSQWETQAVQECAVVGAVDE